MIAFDLGVELWTPPALESNDNESVDEGLDNGVSPPLDIVLAVAGETWISSESENEKMIISTFIVE